ncbi:MAG: carboxymuconolactone decarboxylase family protein [Rhizobiaceae bacterium]|nr:carboxymuconolactone decarboxylase family protein [Rhizobiaceae bacterium]
MSLYTLYTPQTAPAVTGEILSGLRKMIGFVPNVFAIMGSSEPVLRAFVELTTRFGQTSLSPVEQEIVHIAVSVENGCEYCVAGHSAFAKMKNMPDEILAELRRNGTIADPQLAALHDFTREVVRKRGHIGRDALQKFMSAGYSADQVQEVILGISEKTFSNLTSVVFNIPLDLEFSKHRWHPSAGARAA